MPVISLAANLKVSGQNLIKTIPTIENMEYTHLKDTLLKAMEAEFGEDQKRIDHARRVTEYAEKLMEAEGGDYPIIISAAVRYRHPGSRTQIR